MIVYTNNGLNIQALNLCRLLHLNMIDIKILKLFTQTNANQNDNNEINLAPIKFKDTNMPMDNIISMRNELATVNYLINAIKRHYISPCTDPNYPELCLLAKNNNDIIDLNINNLHNYWGSFLEK
jgi:hypothetical protein